MGSKSENIIEVQNPRNTNTRTRRPVGEPGRGRETGQRVRPRVRVQAWRELEKNGRGLFRVREPSNASTWVDGGVTKLPGASETRGAA